MGSVKLIVFDEADELISQEGHITSIVAFEKMFVEGTIPQHIFFSATFNEKVEEKIDSLVGDNETYMVPIESLRLRGLKHFRY